MHSVFRQTCMVGLCHHVGAPLRDTGPSGVCGCKQVAPGTLVPFCQRPRTDVRRAVAGSRRLWTLSFPRWWQRAFSSSHPSCPPPPWPPHISTPSGGVERFLSPGHQQARVPLGHHSPLLLVYLCPVSCGVIFCSRFVFLSGVYLLFLSFPLHSC